MPTHKWESPANGVVEPFQHHIATVIRGYYASDTVWYDKSIDKFPVCGPDGIFFNGVGINGIDPFYYMPGRRGKCGTHESYDIVVCKMLLLLSTFIPHFVYSSTEIATDTDIGATWVQAREELIRDLHIPIAEFKYTPYKD